jgi:hypothetical protein
MWTLGKRVLQQREQQIQLLRQEHVNQYALNRVSNGKLVDQRGNDRK